MVYVSPMNTTPAIASHVIDSANYFTATNVEDALAELYAKFGTVTGGLDWQASVLDKDLTDPPGGEGGGERYIVADAGAGGLWTGKEEQITEYDGDTSSWDFMIPDEGIACWVEDEDTTYVFNGIYGAGGAWVKLGTTLDHENLMNKIHDGDTLQLDGVNSDGGAFSFTTSGAVTYNQQQIYTHAIAGMLDLNPANTGTQNVIDIVPSANLVAGSAWKGMNIDVNDLDPATGVGSDIYGYYMTAENLLSVDKDATVYGYYFKSPKTEGSYGFWHSMEELSESKIARGFISYGSGVFSVSASYYGLTVDWDSITRDANAPKLHGILVDLPADYTNFGTCEAAKFTGDGRTLEICNDDYALETSGAMLLDGVITGIDSITLDAGETIDEYSSDGLMAGNSDTALPTEAAVVTYVAAQIALGFGVHFHDGDTLQHNAVNSDGGAFAFTTTGDVSFVHGIIIKETAGATVLQLDSGTVNEDPRIDLRGFTDAANEIFRMYLDDSTLIAYLNVFPAITGGLNLRVNAINAIHIATTGTVSIPYELDMTGVSACIDLNPAGSGNIIDITPTAAMTGGANWFAIKVVGAALDPADAGSELRGVSIDFTGVDMTNNPSIYGIAVTLPAVYGSSTERAAHFSGDGRTVIICEDASAINVSGKAKFDNELELNGALAFIDLNPAGTGTKNIVDITPSASLVAGSTWKGIYQNLTALDPATGAPCNVYGIEIDASGVVSIDNDAEIRGFSFIPPATEDSQMMRHEITEMTQNKYQQGFWSTGTLVLSATATYQGIWIDWDAITRDAGAPILHGIRVNLPANYTGFGTSYAGKFTGDGRTVEICNDVDAIQITGHGGTSGLIDINPSAGGQQWVIVIDPGQTSGDFQYIRCEFDALNPSAAVTVFGIELVTSGMTSVGNDCTLYGFSTLGNATNTYYGVRSRLMEATLDIVQTAFYGDILAGLGTNASGTYRGLHIDWDNATRDANAPVLEALKIQMPANYANFGASYAGYFSGDGRSVTICDTTYALDISGIVRTSTDVTVGGDLTLSDTRILDAGVIEQRIGANADRVVVHNVADYYGSGDGCLKITLPGVPTGSTFFRLEIEGWQYRDASSDGRSFKWIVSGFRNSGDDGWYDGANYGGSFEIVAGLGTVDVTERARFMDGAGSPADALYICLGEDADTRTQNIYVVIKSVEIFSGGASEVDWTTGWTIAPDADTTDLTHERSAWGASHLAGNSYFDYNGNLRVANNLNVIGTGIHHLHGSTTITQAVGNLEVILDADSNAVNTTLYLLEQYATLGAKYGGVLKYDSAYFQIGGVSNNAEKLAIRIDKITGDVHFYEDVVIAGTAGLIADKLWAVNPSDSTETLRMEYDHANDRGRIYAYDTGVGYKNLYTDSNFIIGGDLTVVGNDIGVGGEQGYIHTNFDGSDEIVGVWSFNETDFTASCVVGTGLSVHRITYDDLTASSSIAKKENIVNLDPIEVSEALRGIGAKSYNLIYEKDVTKIGLIAEELPTMIRSEEGYDLTSIVAMLITKVNYLESRLEEAGVLT